MADSSSSCSCLDKSFLDEIIHRLSSGITDQERDGAKEIRKLTKLSSVNRISIAEVGAIPCLLKILKSNDMDAQAHSIAALLNLTLRNEANKQAIITAKGLDAIGDVLQKGGLQESRETAAALLFNLSYSNNYRTMVSSLPGVFCGLVELLRNGSPRGKKDAAAALFSLLQIRQCRALAVRAGAVPPLLHIAQDLSLGLVDESLTVLLNLATHQEGRFAIRKASGIRILVDMLRRGSDSNKEYTCAVLYVLCSEDFACVEEVLNAGGDDVLVTLSISGNERTQRKAVKLMELLK